MPDESSDQVPSEAAAETPEQLAADADQQEQPVTGDSPTDSPASPEATGEASGAEEAASEDQEAENRGVKSRLVLDRSDLVKSRLRAFPQYLKLLPRVPPRFQPYETPCQPNWKKRFKKRSAMPTWMKSLRVK